MEENVYQVLKDLEIEFMEFRHPPVFTVEDAEIHWKNIEATHCKNLFLRDKKGRNHFLVVLPHNQQFDIRQFGENTSTGRLSFASEQRLDTYLGLRAGSVSPFGLINDQENHVKVYISNDLKAAETLGFHPNVNTITITLTFLDFEKYLKWVGNSYQYF